MSSHPVITVGLLVLAVGLWLLLVRRWRRDWPIVTAAVEMRPPDSSWGWFHGDLLYRGEKKEPWALYEYSGAPRSCRIAPTFTASGGPFLLWTSKPNSKEISVRVNPHSPDHAYPANSAKEWPYFLGLGALLVLIGAALSAN